MAWVVSADFGVAAMVIEFTNNGTVVNLSSYTTLQILLSANGATATTFTAAFTTDGSDGKIEYTPATGEVSGAGRWEIQGRVLKTGARLSTQVGLFEVMKAL